MKGRVNAGGAELRRRNGGRGWCAGAGSRSGVGRRRGAAAAAAAPAGQEGAGH